MTRFCDNCGRSVPEEEQAFTLRLEMFATADVIDVNADEAARDNLAELQALVERMDHMDDHEVSEAEAEVYESYMFTLCRDCRGWFHQQLAGRRSDRAGS